VIEKNHLSCCLTCVSWLRVGFAEGVLGADDSQRFVYMMEILDEVTKDRYLSEIGAVLCVVS